mmetsp:Transcript_69239/g.212281  ORF Transcript_69239/g.212281 Transcript_69239/m.212281 type:complete len:241 (+) Transcript_69239:502-1224(+)
MTRGSTTIGQRSFRATDAFCANSSFRLTWGRDGMGCACGIGWAWGIGVACAMGIACATGGAGLPAPPACFAYKGGCIEKILLMPATISTRPHVRSFHCVRYGKMTMPPWSTCGCPSLMATVSLGVTKHAGAIEGYNGLKRITTGILHFEPWLPIGSTPFKRKIVACSLTAPCPFLRVCVSGIRVPQDFIRAATSLRTLSLCGYWEATLLRTSSSFMMRPSAAKLIAAKLLQQNCYMPPDA